MKILFITQKADKNDPVLGFMHAWFESLSARFDALHLLVLKAGERTLPDNVTVHCMAPGNENRRFVKFLNFVRVVSALVLRRRVDAVFAHMCPIYAVLAAPFCRLRGVPLLMWITHSSDTPMLRIAHRLVDKVITASDASCALSGAKVVVTGHGIDMDLFSPAPAPANPAEVRILSVGRVTPIKDYTTIIRAADILARERGLRGFSVSIVGACYSESDNKHKEELEAEIRKAGLDGIVRFEGPTTHDKMPDWYRRSQVFVSACHTRAMDKAVLEAMGCGVPVTTCIESYKPLLDQSAPGLYFEKGDERSLADALERLLAAGPEGRAELGLVQRRLAASRHSFHALMDRLAHEINKSIYDKRSSSPRTRWLVAHTRGKDILDIGFAAASFPFLHYFIKDANPDSTVTGCDLFHDKIKRCANVTGVAGDACSLPFRDSAFDCVVFAEIYEHLLEPVPALREIARALRPGGQLLFSTPSPYEPLRWVRGWLLARKPWDAASRSRYLVDDSHIQFPDPVSLFNMLDILGFEVIEAQTLKHRIPGLSKIWRKAQALDIPFFPFTRLGSSLCLRAVKR